MRGFLTRSSRLASAPFVHWKWKPSSTLSMWGYDGRSGAMLSNTLQSMSQCTVL